MSDSDRSTFGLSSGRPIITVPGRPWIRTTFQLAASMPAAAGTAEAKWLNAIACVLRWAKQKISGGLPQEAWKGESFSRIWPGQKLESIAVQSRGLWTLRLEQPDVPFRGQPAVAGRTWTTDVSFVKQDDQFRVGVRVFCASLPHVDAVTAFTRPRIVIDLAREAGLCDLRSLAGVPWLLQSEADVEKLYELVLDPKRLLPIVIMTQPDKRRLGVHVSDYVVNPDEIAKQLLGLAHVVKLPWGLGYKWTELVGKPWSVYLGAVRTYMPGFCTERDVPSAHPSVFAEKIIFWKNIGDERIGETPFTEFLLGKVSQFSAFRRLDWGNLAFASEARTIQAEVAREQAQEGTDWKQLFEDEITGLKEKVTELQAEVQEYCQISDQVERDRDQYKEENRQLRFQVNSLRQALSERTGGKSEAEIGIPDNYEDLGEWVIKHLTGQVVLHSRAFRGLKDAKYEDVALVYRSLLLLANEYRNQALGRDGAKDAFEKKLNEHGLRINRSISKERAGEQGDEYFVRFPTASSPKRFVEWHLRKGSTKDDRYCLGLYFFWDEDTEQVVVAWLPSHLDNRMT